METKLKKIPLVTQMQSSGFYVCQNYTYLWVYWSKYQFCKGFTSINSGKQSDFSDLPCHLFCAALSFAACICLLGLCSGQTGHTSTAPLQHFCMETFFIMKASEGAWHDKAIKKHLCPHPELLPHNQPFPPLFNRQDKLENSFRRNCRNLLYFLLQLEIFQRKKVFIIDLRTGASFFLPAP